LAEFKNPNQAGGGGTDSRSFLVMMVVMVGVIVGLQYYRNAHNTPTAPPDQHAPAAQASAPPPASTPAAQTAAPAAAPVTPTIVAQAETPTVVENDLYKITFSNRGGQVTSWVLKKYKDNTGKPLDLVHDGAAAQFGYPLSLYTYDATLTRQLATALYVPSATGALQSPASLTYTYAAGRVKVTKTFAFGADYLIHADTEVLVDGNPVRSLLSWPGGLGDMETAIAYNSANIDSSSNGHDDHEAAKKISGGATLPGPFDFAGTSDQYFAAVFLPDQPSNASLVTLHHQMDVKDLPRGAGRTGLGGGSAKESLVPVLGTAVGGLDGHTQERVFVGPKSIDVLRSIHTASGGDLQPLLDFGFFGPIGKYLFLGLHWVHGLLPHDLAVSRNYSWGWAIVLFTVLINLVLLPLRIKGMKSMLAMQRIQPGIDAIKAKYKNPKATDPKMAEMNAEVMAYQKEHGVSMFGGCVPSLIQLPLLFAFFTMMTRVVELRQAHFYWLPDLSAADPYHILPIAMVVTSFLVQFYTPAPGVDPQQQKMMAFMMPAFSGWMTWNYASGLALYWNVGNLIMLLQQAVMTQTSIGKEMKEIAARRARRSTTALSGKPAPKTIPARR
jgi:YidC/Oxa1 family membrane protein insertase